MMRPRHLAMAGSISSSRTVLSRASVPVSSDFHEPAVADDVRRQYGREPALDARLLHRIVLDLQTAFYQ